MIYDQQEREMEKINICGEILRSARTELYMSMHFLDVALGSLGFMPEGQIYGLGCDGQTLFFSSDFLIHLYRQGRLLVNRSYLHVVFHCLFGHLKQTQKEPDELWNLACDIVVESVIDKLSVKSVYRNLPPYRRDIYSRFYEKHKVLTAPIVARELAEQNLKDSQFSRLREEFYIDDHSRWNQNVPKKAAMERDRKWEDIQNKLETRMDSFSKESGSGKKALEDQVKAENRKKYDYREFLRKFSVLKEEMQVDLDSFDYIFYHYGLELYGDMPLIEPLETKEVQRIEDFVIAIDTSMSCEGELVRRFLDETYGILSQSESFFRKINVHVIQCDEQIQEDTVIHSRQEMEQYLMNFTVKGQGGTDFRPVFGYISQLMAAKQFTKLKGLIYFTDGYGVFPSKKPAYDTAFVFWGENYYDADVPPWAIKLVLEEINEY